MAAGPNADSEGKSPFTPKFDELVTQAFDSENFLGLSIAIVEGAESFTKGYGIATLPDTLVTPDTLFYGGSTTKAFCAAAASLLVDDSEKHKDIQWTTPISQLIRDDFVLQDPYWTDHVTIEDALSHRTGYPRHDKCCIGTNGNVRQTVRNLRHLPTSREARTVAQYCNSMFVAVSHAIEVVTGEDLGDFLNRRIWKPLGMTSTYFSQNEAKKSGKPFAHGYHWDKDKNHQVPVPSLDLSDVSGAGCIISNVIDYARWIRTMINMEGPMSRKAHEALVKPLIAIDFDSPAEFPDVFYGLGWFMLWYHNEKIIFHPGDIYGFSAVVMYLPQRAWGCAMMSNSDYAAPALQKLMWYLIDELLGVPETKRVDWDGRSKKQKQKAAELAANVRERLYPEAALDVAPSLPIHAYAGKYFHPAYPTLNLTVKDGALHADVSERRWPFATTFEHVSGEHFIARTSQPCRDDDEVVPAEFGVDAKGTATKLRVRYQEGVEMIEFIRV